MMNYQDNNWWFIFFQDHVLIHNNNGQYCTPTNLPDFIETNSKNIHHFDTQDGIKCFAVEVDSNHIPSESLNKYEYIGLRDSYFKLTLSMYQMAGKAFQLIHWDKNSLFCPACGTRTEQITSIMKRCPNCHKEQYPQVNTAMIVLIHKGDEILLAHAHNFKRNFYGLLAGFLEVGETLEECVAREVYEETQVRVKNIQYFGNQPWPYPSGLMVGYIAEYDSGEIKIQEEELRSAEFYNINNLPELPQKLSLARIMIDAWLDKKGVPHK